MGVSLDPGQRSHREATPGRATDAQLLWTLAQALEISGAKLLELDGRKPGILVIPAGEQGRGLGAVVYDNVPGGADQETPKPLSSDKTLEERLQRASQRMASRKKHQKERS